jgi:hypothetical protein
MSWATLAIVAMARHMVPTWPATIFAGLATGLAIATRTGGIITHAYLIGAMSLCAVEARLLCGRATRGRLVAIGIRSSVVIAVGWVTAIALWPWLQIGNPFAQFRTALVHFATIPTAFPFPHWGEEAWSNALPWTYIPGQWLVRLPVVFLALVVVAVFLAAAKTIWFAQSTFGRLRDRGVAGLRRPALLLARGRRILIVWAAAAMPVAFLIIQNATLYDGIRHTLFVIPILGLLAGWALLRMLPYLRRVVIPVIALWAAYVVGVIGNLAMLHPLEYVATNAIAGGTQGSYGRFELDYWSAAATEALRRLEQRLGAAGAFAGNDPPTLLICIPYREHMIGPMLRQNWRIELDANKADFIIKTERSSCTANVGKLVLIDEVRRFNRTFGWTYVNKDSHFLEARRR